MLHGLARPEAPWRACRPVPPLALGGAHGGSGPRPAADRLERRAAAVDGLGWQCGDGGGSVAPLLTYLGPCLTPAETEQALAAAVPAVPPEREEPRGLAALAASATPPPPPAMVFRKDAVRNHLLIFAGTLFGTLFLAEWILGAR